jgi:signal transduction histidine kinase/CheY-like chemotaxis protein
MNANSTIPPPQKWRLRLRHWPGKTRPKEREWLFFSFLIILSAGYAAFALVAWGLDFHAGVLANGLGIVAMSVLGALRWRGFRLGPLITALQTLTLAQAFAVTWLTGGIYSATIGWLALAPLPAVLAYSQRARIAGLVAGWLLILGLYGYALLGGEMALNILPQDLIHWHLMMAVVIFGIQLALLQRLSTVRKQRMQSMQQHSRKLRQIHKQLQHNQQQKDLFVASVSHELRTPMNAILGLADLIQHDKGLHSDVREKMADIQKSGEHLLTIINDLLDHAQMEAGRLQVVKEPFNLHDCLKISFQLLKRRAETKPVNYSLRIDPDVPQWVMGDSHRLTQVLVNLLGNAIKFTAQGEIELHCGLPQNDHENTPKSTPESPSNLRDGQPAQIIRLAVRDSGIGIAPELQHRVFQSFSQADNSIARRFGGNGLGLSITRGLVEAMGGRIGFDSLAGVGSTFHVLLPCAVCAPVANAHTVEEEAKSEKALRILIADDNPMNRQIASLQLRRHFPNAQVTSVDNGLEAFEAVRDGERFDVILMDLLMPEMDGQTATQKIRNELPQPQCDTPIIALTANADQQEWARCLAVGMNECMLKPFNRLVLVKRVLFYVV